MNPGRELDALIAQKVMGFKIRKYIAKDNHYTRIELSDFLSIELPYYSTKIEDAWEVVQKITEMQHLEPEISINHTRIGWFVRLFKPIAKLAYEVTAIDTAPHAICLAALKAVGYAIKEES